MLQVRRAQERGHANHGWLDSYHTFSFADYYDPKFMGLGPLRVINEDRVAPGAGFGTHPHRDMEILSYVIEGQLEHRDSMGNGSMISPGEVQRMSAGTGVTHSEYNPSKSSPVRFLQIWIQPAIRGLKPSYEQRVFGEERLNTLRLVASPDGGHGSVVLHQDVQVYASELQVNRALEYRILRSRAVWLQLIHGDLTVNGEALRSGDGLAVLDEDALSLTARSDAHFLLFDLNQERSR